MRTILIIIYLFALLIFSAIMRLIDKVKKLDATQTYSAFHKIAKHLNSIGGNHYELIGSENIPDEAVLIVSNHESYFDPLTIVDIFDKQVAMVGKVELTKVPTLKYWSRKFGTEFIDRNDMKQSIRVIISASKTLKSGKNVCIFPEGTRSDEQMEFKAGSFKIAQNAKAPILPITIDNTSGVFEANKPKRLKKCTPIITIHPAISYEQYKEQNLISLASDVQKIVYGE